jgi:hypothetical protein
MPAVTDYNSQKAKAIQGGRDLIGDSDMRAANASVGRPRDAWVFSYYDLADITGKSVNAIQQSKNRPGGFDPEDLLSLAFWLVRNAPPELKVQFMQHATSIHTDVVPVNARRRKTTRR